MKNATAELDRFFADMVASWHNPTPGVRMMLRRKHAALPTAHEAKHLPLHAKPVKPMNLNAVIKMMTPTTVKRFVEILKSLDYNPKAVTPDPPPHMFRIPEHHAKRSDSR
jgi:hypothetical protein